ncbi:MAG: outer membrane protein assembly factor BamA [Candidatus Hydrogenedentes bacterium]|nr:outer membrane protein assembly factor BamA [Candidatus Hydrogenedentota bacterium]
MKKFYLNIVVVFVVVGLTMLWHGNGAFAQDAAPPTVQDVLIEGLSRISDAAARAQLETQAGNPFDAGAVARDIKRLYETGYFETVNSRTDESAAGVVVVYSVTEKRIIGEVRIIGNKKIKTKNIRAVLSMREGAPFQPDLFEEERDAILALYEGKGYTNTFIEVNSENIGPNSVRLIYDISEGGKARIHSISFEGNDSLSNRALRKTMKTKRARWFMGGRYEEAKFEADLKNIIDKYGDNGYLEADIVATDMVYSKNGKAMDVVIHMDEGQQYTMESLDIANNAVYDDEELLSTVEVLPGSIHNKGQVAADVALIEQGYQDSGYIDSVVTPQITLDRETKTTHAVYHINEGDLKYVREIRVTGNDVTKDEVIRRQMLLIPGERYDGAAVTDSENRIKNTRFFDKTRITFAETDDELFTDLLVNVEEGKTGTFNFGAGYSTEDRLGVYSEVRLNNFDIFNWPSFSGGGQQLRLRVQVGDRRDQYSLSFTEPEFLGYPLTFGFDVFDESYDVRGAARYREEARGGQIRFGKALSPTTMVMTALRYQETDLRDLEWYYNPVLRMQAGESTTIANSWSIERNTLDSRFDPNRGYVHLLVGEVAGLGGDHEFWRIEQDSSWFRSLGEKEKWVLSVRARHGVMDTYGSSKYVPLQERFYAGGTATVRGYRNRDIGPKIREYWLGGDRFAIGGNARAVYNVEAKFRATDIFRVYAFADAGGVWDEVGDVSFGDLNYSVGTGIGFNVPMLGPIRVDYGYPLNPGRHQSSSGRLHMSTGFRF